MNSKLPWLVGLLLLVVGMLAACGQKGPLFLPDKAGQDRTQSR